MTAPVPPVDIDQLETALRAATPGPWQRHRWEVRPVVGEHLLGPAVVTVPEHGDEADAAAIVAAVNAASDLIAELRDLRATRDAVQALANRHESDRIGAAQYVTDWLRNRARAEAAGGGGPA